jgi:hypothetical protein
VFIRVDYAAATRLTCDVAVLNSILWISVVPVSWPGLLSQKNELGVSGTPLFNVKIARIQAVPQFYCLGYTDKLIVGRHCHCPLQTLNMPNTDDSNRGPLHSAKNDYTSAI